MEKFFNIAGPCNPVQHYMLPPQDRCQGIMRLIDRGQFFVIYAARQTGKTTLLLELAQELSENERYYALYCSLEVVQNITDPEKGMPAIVKKLQKQIHRHRHLNTYPFALEADYEDYTTVLQEAFFDFCGLLDKPLVVLFDEVDCLSNGTLISFLRQLRDGYINRRQIPFPQSVALVGMRNIRDYKGKIRDEGDTLGSTSPFNIVADSFTLRNFTLEEIVDLYNQHTILTTQVFSKAVVKQVYHYSQGQPWLVNAIAREVVEKILNFDYTKPITTDHIKQAAQTIAKRRDTHIDSLLERLKEERVQKIIEPLILGKTESFSEGDDDFQYTLDLGLIKKIDKQVMPANPIYAEIIVRRLSSKFQQQMDTTNYPPYAPLYLAEGRLNIKQLLTDFQQFWRENSEIWLKGYQYQEAAPHLVLQAFLQRILNGGGSITREMALGKKALDLCVHYQNIAYPIELKLRYSKKAYQEGQVQLAEYMDKLGCKQGWLIVFDRRKKPTWTKKIFWRTEQVGDKVVHVVGC